NATGPPASAPRRPCRARAPRSASAPTATPSSTCWRKRAPWSSTSGCAPAPAATGRPTPCCAPPPPTVTPPSAGTGPAPSPPARPLTSPRSPWTRSGRQDHRPAWAPRRPSSPPPRPTCATRSSRAGTSCATARTPSSPTCRGRWRTPSGPCTPDDRPRTPRRATYEDTMSSTAITGIATLVTNDPALGRGDSPLGLIRDAAVVIEGDRVVWTGASGDTPATDHRVDAGGRAVLPGFVDSHSHLVFAGDRTEEFNARMSGRPYSAGGIRTTVAATRAADD